MHDAAETTNNGTRVDEMLPPVLLAQLVGQLSFMDAPQTVLRGRNRVNGLTAEMLGLDKGKDIQDD